jgi:hypothetical protein
MRSGSVVLRDRQRNGDHDDEYGVSGHSRTEEHQSGGDAAELGRLLGLEFYSFREM